MNTGPLARRDGLVVKTVDDELLVYDLERHRAHSLNALAAAIWRACDGRRPAAEVAAAVRTETDSRVTDAAVEYGLASLGRARLLAGGERPRSGPTRRQVLGGLGTAAIPLVLSIVAPTAAHAQSCAGVGDPCINGSSCCNGAGVCFDQVTLDPCFSGGPNCVCGPCCPA